jgi:hypothetical protein
VHTGRPAVKTQDQGDSWDKACISRVSANKEKEWRFSPCTTGSSWYFLRLMEPVSSTVNSRCNDVLGARVHYRYIEIIATSRISLYCVCTSTVQQEVIATSRISLYRTLLHRELTVGGVGLLRCVGRRSAVVFGVLSNTMHVLSCRHSKQASITHCHGIRRGQYCQPRTPIKPVHSPN